MGICSRLFASNQLLVPYQWAVFDATTSEVVSVGSCSILECHSYDGAVLTGTAKPMLTRWICRYIQLDMYPLTPEICHPRTPACTFWVMLQHTLQVDQSTCRMPCPHFAEKHFDRNKVGADILSANSPTYPKTLSTHWSSTLEVSSRC